MNQGWVCPKCGVVYAPSVTECRCQCVPMERVDWSKYYPAPATMYQCPACATWTPAGLAHLCPARPYPNPDITCKCGAHGGSVCGMAEDEGRNTA